VRVSAKADYAVRAAIEIAASADGERPLKGEAIGAAQGIPLPFLQNILAELRHAGIVHSKRGADGGHWLTRPADEVTIADVIRAVDGPLANVRGAPAEELTYQGAAEPLQSVWLALRANVREVLESVSLADLVDRDLPQPVLRLSEDPDVRRAR
jgi:Rrf2 family protein